MNWEPIVAEDLVFLNDDFDPEGSPHQWFMWEPLVTDKIFISDSPLVNDYPMNHAVLTLYVNDAGVMVVEIEDEDDYARRYFVDDFEEWEFLYSFRPGPEIFGLTEWKEYWYEDFS